MDLRRYCSYDKCVNIASGKCAGHQSCMWCPVDGERYAFANDCGEYFCREHLKWGWGLYCINCCIASPQCPKHHTGIHCCTIL